jgi:uncharacterized membrane protein
VPSILLIQLTYGLTTVFVCLAIILIIAAVSVTQLGPEAKQLGLDEVEPPTKNNVDAGPAFWLKFAGAVALLLSLSWWLYFYLAAKEIANTLPCLLYTAARCETLVAAAEAAGKFAFRPYLTWVGVALIVVGIVMAMTNKPATKTA